MLRHTLTTLAFVVHGGVVPTVDLFCQVGLNELLNDGILHKDNPACPWQPLPELYGHAHMCVVMNTPRGFC